jgi:hypothetical protein
MIHLSQQSIANTAHVFISAYCVTLPVALHLSHGQWYGSLFIVVCGLAKEMWFDLEYEDEETSGGIVGGCIDFAGYVAGMIAANIILAIF